MGAERSHALVSLPRAGHGPGQQGWQRFSWFRTKAELWGFPEYDECLGHLGPAGGARRRLGNVLAASTHPLQSCFCAWFYASGVGWMLLQEDVHSLLIPLFFLLPRCLQILPVCNVILWQSTSLSFAGCILHSSDSACHSHREAFSLPLLTWWIFKTKALSTKSWGCIFCAPWLYH